MEENLPWEGNDGLAGQEGSLLGSEEPASLIL